MHPEDGANGAFCPGFVWPPQGREVVAASSLKLAVQRGAKIFSEACRELGPLVGIVREISAQACWHLCPRQPGPLPAQA